MCKVIAAFMGMMTQHINKPEEKECAKPKCCEKPPEKPCYNNQYDLNKIDFSAVYLSISSTRA